MREAIDTDDTVRTIVPARQAPVLALGTIAAGIGILSIGALTSETQFSRGLELAVAATDLPATHQTQTAARVVPPIAGSEAFWLGKPESTGAVKPVAFVNPRLAVGSRYRFGGGSETRTLEVTAVRALDIASGGDDQMPAAPVLVTFKDVSSPAGAPIRMLLDSHAPLAGLTPLPSEDAQRDL